MPRPILLFSREERTCSSGNVDCKPAPCALVLGLAHVQWRVARVGGFRLKIMVRFGGHFCASWMLSPRGPWGFRPCGSAEGSAQGGMWPGLASRRGAEERSNRGCRSLCWESQGGNRWTEEFELRLGGGKGTTLCSGIRLHITATNLKLVSQR